jgi:hypothetical protein
MLSKARNVSSIAQPMSLASTGDPSECRHPNSLRASAMCSSGGLSFEAAKGRARRPAGRSMEPGLAIGSLLAM